MITPASAIASTRHTESEHAGIVWLDDAPCRPRRLAIGVFDGVHRGHREVMAGCDCAVTFDPHPLAVVGAGRAPLQITSLERRAELAASVGVRELVVVGFDEHIADMEPERFIEDVLVDRLAASLVCVGPGFRFGRKARGGPALLEGHVAFETRVAPDVRVGGQSVSSTRIRQLVASGRLSEAVQCLGAPLRLCGIGRPRHRAGDRFVVSVRPGWLAPPPGTYACAVNGAPGLMRVHARKLGSAVKMIEVATGGAALDADAPIRLELAGPQ